MRELIPKDFSWEDYRYFFAQISETSYFFTIKTQGHTALFFHVHRDNFYVKNTTL